MRFLLGLILSLFVTVAQAADNTVIVTPGAGVTLRSKDVGSGVESMMQILGDTSGNPLATAPGTGNSVFALPVQGVSGGVALTVSGLVTANPGTAANWGIGATGSAVPANAQYIGIISGGNLTGWTGAVTNAGTFAVQATESGTWNITNITGTVSLPAGASTSALQPTNSAQGGTTSGQTGTVVFGAVTTGSPSYTTGQSNPLSLDTAGNLRVNVVAGGAGGGAVTIASGAVASGAYASGSIASGAFASGSISSGANVTEGTTSPSVTCSTTWTINGCLSQIDSDIKSPIPAATAPYGIIGGVINGADTYNTIAASQTTQALTGGSGGATGDYLSHCVIQPTTTAAGTVTIFDNATSAFVFTTGTLSNLVPFTIPVGAVSVSGAWKVTTGANETATCVGKFH